jgi:hypothetical protein
MSLILIQKILRIITLIVVLGYLSYAVYYALAYDTIPTYRDCGKVVSLGDDVVVTKRSSYTEFYVNVQFKDTGFKSMRVCPTTYFSTEPGDTVCFDLNKEMTVWHHIHHGAGIITMIIGGLVMIIMFLIFLFYDVKSIK